MQSPPLPVQLTSASPAPSTPRNQGGQPDGGAQFSAALSREMVQQKPTPAPKSTPPAKAAAPQPPAKPAQADKADKPAQPDQAAAPAAPAKAADGAAHTTDEGAERAAADAAAAAAGNPLYELMAMVASFNQAPAAAAATAAAALPATAAQPGVSVAPDATALMAASARLSGQQAMPDLAPALPDTPAPAASFSNMMGKVDGAMQEGLEAAAAALGQPRPQPSVAAQGVPQERAPLTDTARDSGAVHGAPTPAPLAVTSVREALPEPVALKEAPVAAVTMAPVQQASLALPQAGAIQAADRIAARVGTPGWDNQVAQKIVWMVAGKEQSATLTLNPPDMGPMQVVLSVNNDQATVTFSAGQPEVRQALLDAMPKLREMMGESGIALGNASVHDGSANGQQQQARGDAPGSGNAGAANATASGSAAEAEARMAARPARSGELPGLVNTFA